MNASVYDPFSVCAMSVCLIFVFLKESTTERKREVFLVQLPMMEDFAHSRRDSGADM